MADTFSLVVTPAAIENNPPLQAELDVDGTVERYQTFRDASKARRWVEKMERMGKVPLELIPAEAEADIDGKLVPAGESNVDEIDIGIEDESGIDDFLDDAF